MATLSWRLTDAVIPVLSSVSATSLGLASLSKPLTPRRRVFFSVAILILRVTSFSTASRASPVVALNQVLARFQLMELMQLCYLHFILDATDLLRADAKQDHLQLQPQPNWFFAYKLLYNSRVTAKSIGSTPTTRNGQDFSKGTKGDVAGPYDSYFVWRRIALCACKYVMLHTLLHDPVFDMASYTPDGKRWNKNDVAPGNRDYLLHLLCLLGHWTGLCTIPLDAAKRACILGLESLIEIWMEYLRLGYLYDGFSAVAVFIHLDRPEDWPPLFGQLGDAFTVRRFWSHFWHRVVYNCYSAFASSFSTKILRLPPRTTSSRYAKLILVFLLSGCLAQLVNNSKSHCVDSGFLVYFLMQAVGIIIEELFQQVVHLFEKRLSDRGVCTLETSSSWRLVKRVLGYAWVALWMIYVKVKTSYGVRYCYATTI